MFKIIQWRVIEKANTKYAPLGQATLGKLFIFAIYKIRLKAVKNTYTTARCRKILQKMFLLKRQTREND
jgi:hypothetical protein